MCSFRIGKRKISQITKAFKVARYVIYDDVIIAVRISTMTMILIIIIT